MNPPVPKPKRDAIRAAHLAGINIRTLAVLHGLTTYAVAAILDDPPAVRRRGNANQTPDADVPAAIEAWR